MVLDGRGLSTEAMQRIAREMNLSETTFVFPPDDAAHAAHLRIFTPFLELPFAGHPTIGTAWVLANEGMVTVLDFVLEENVGSVPVHADSEDGRITRFWMTHPPLRFGNVVPHKRVAASVGIDEDLIVHDVPAQIATTGTAFLFVVLRDPAAVDVATADPARVRTLLHGTGAHGVMLVAEAGPERLYVRMFGEDVPEDPATGSAAGPLGGYAVKYGIIKRAPTVPVKAEQGTRMGRQSFIHIALTYDGDPDIPSRIEVGGSVMPVLSGVLEARDPG